METKALRKLGWMGLAFVGLLVCMQIAFGNSAQPVASKTGAPGENKCIQCHTGTAGTGSVAMVFGNNETQYVPGQVYTIQVTTTDATKTRFGFQITALAGGVGATVGTFTITNTTNTASQTGTISGFLRKYVSHKAANATQVWTFNWTAPPTDMGPITFFLVGLGANSSNSSAGDKVYSTTFTITAVPPPPPVAQFTAADTTPCAFESVTFNDQSTNTPSSHSWTFPGGTPGNSTDPNPTVIYTVPGIYDVTLIVGNVSGADTISFTNYITVNALPTLGALPAATSCFAGNDGSIDLTPTGSSPFTYAWSQGSTSEDPSGLAPGDYTVTVTDANGCTASGTFNVSAPIQIALNFTSQSANCAQANGSATVTPSGGVGGYTYLWSTGDTTATTGSLPAGSFHVTVTDANGCQMTGSTAVSNVGAPSGNFATTDATCNGDTDGMVDLTLTGGTAPFSFQWSNGATTEDISGLAAGPYSVTVTSSDGCVLSQVVVINQPPALNTTVSSTPEMAGADGTATVTATGGNGSYAYLWSNGQTTATAVNLTAGTYTVTVTDSLGCNTSVSVNVSLVISVAGSVERELFSIGPNPFRDYITLTPTVSMYGKLVVHLVDIKGRMVYANEIYAKGSFPIQVAPGSIPNGVYLLMINTGKGSMVRKVMRTSF
jgi:PKD repeat protein